MTNITMENKDKDKSKEVGAAALAAMKQMQLQETKFLKPAIPVHRKTKKKTQFRVLDEDTYLEEMAKIIQRDFFPDLEKLKAQNEFLDATERKDHQKLRELFIKYSSGHRAPSDTPYMPNITPATFDTPLTNITPLIGVSSERGESFDPSNEIIDGEEARIKPKISPNISLDSYLATYTSEDNMSFQDLMEEMGRRSRAKFASQLHEEEQSQLLMLKNTEIPSIEQQANHIDKPLELDTWAYKAKNYIMYVPDGVAPLEDAAKEKQEVVHANTRLEVEPFNYQQSKETISQLAKSQEKILSGRIGVDGSTLLEEKKRLAVLGASESNNASAAVSFPLSHSLVRTPSPCPGAGGETPLMTWGEIEGTPFRLDGSDTPLISNTSGAAFKMATIPKRERIALALADKASQRHRASKQKAEAAKRSMLSPSPRMATGSTSERLAMMSPAAQRLATSQMRRNLGISPSPSPRVFTPSIGTGSRKSTTPLVISNKRKLTTPVMSEEDKRIKSNITDDLLQINLPKRNRLTASDFFS